MITSRYWEVVVDLPKLEELTDEELHAHLGMVKAEVGRRKRAAYEFYKDTQISSLELSVRLGNALARAGVQTLGQLCLKSEAEVLSMRSLGLKSFNEVQSILADRGLTLDFRISD